MAGFVESGADLTRVLKVAELQEAAAAKPSVGLISISSIADDPRVRRQGDAFHAAGWNVVGIGLSGALSPPPAWRQAVHSWDGPRRRSMPQRGMRAARMLAVRTNENLAGPLFWNSAGPFAEIYALASRQRPSLWIANDWTALPIASRLAQEHGVPFAYDTHELASDEHSERLLWRIFNRPMILAIEKATLRRAALVTCVSQGISERLQELYDLVEPPLVVRNTPSYCEMPFRPTGERVEILYHGLVAPGRGLVECIQSVPSWREEFRLTIRGPSTPDFLEVLAREVELAKVGDRVRLAPPVAMTELVAQAASFDIGLFALPSHSRHNQLALPNKIFEYTMAGLALCVSDLPEIARLVREHDVGLLISGSSPQAIAASVNRFTRQSIDQYKQKALAAARVLNWSRESAKLIESCRSIVDRAPGTPPLQR